MTFFIDNNFSYRIADALAAVNENVTHLTDHFPSDTDDEVWIPWVGAQGWEVVTRDEKITRKPGQAKAMRDAGIGAFIFVQKNEETLWGWFHAFVKRWPEFKRIADARRPPYIARVPQRGRIEVK